MKKYRGYIKRYLPCFILGPLFMILEACGEFILPYMNANIINVGAANGDVAYILRYGLYMLLISAGMLAAGVLGANFAIRGAAYLAHDLRRDVFGHIQKFSFSDIDDFTAGSLITRITNDVTQVQTFTQTLLRSVFRSPVMLIGALGMAFALNGSLALVILAVVPLLALAIFLIIRAASPRYATMQRKLDELNANIGETLTNERVIKSFVREEYETARFSAASDALMNKSMAALKLMIVLQPVSAIAVNAATLAVVWVAGRQIMAGGMELGTLTAFITYLTQILTALNMLANIVLMGSRAAASDRRITEVLTAQTALTDADAAFPDKRVERGSVSFRNVSFGYAPGKPVLDNINLDVEPGEQVGVVGATGSGKTTLISLIPRLYDCGGGAVLVDGTDVRDYSLVHLREDVAVVLQKNTLFSGTIAENLRWGDENADDDRLREAAAAAQADEFVRAFPDGYDTDLSQGGVNLSGGQKQRLCIARALVKRPKILILDDSTSAVDTATEAKIRAAFDELKDTTKIIIAQRISSVMDADKIVVMDEGRIVAVGRHDQLMRDCQTYREIYFSQKEA